jgi:tryptophan halogenase
MKFIVVGGGTSGWLTALFTRKIFPDAEIKVIASSEIGILGAGEGSTPQFPQFLKRIDISPSDIIKNAKGTLKNGIKFTNWNGDGEHYYHGFQDNLDYLKKTNYNYRAEYLNKIKNNKCLDDLHLTPYISEQKQVKYRKDTNEPVGQDSLHFDANLLAKYLQSVAFQRNIELIDDEVVGINTHEDNYIKSLTLKNKGEETLDFVFDCTGFRRLIIGDFYKTKWNSYKDKLPMNRAMPFFIQNEGEQLPPYTESIAMKYGWIWKIPVQGRYGCGYVFDSSFASDEEILQEIRDMFGDDVVSPRTFSFDAGYYDKVCVNNCIAVGLSSGFVEPLEATSIWVQIVALTQFEFSRNEILTRNQKYIDNYNQTLKSINQSVLNFIYFHYLTPRNDSNFWKTFREKNQVLPFIEKLSEICEENIPEKEVYEYLTSMENVRIGCQNVSDTNIFSRDSWLQVGSGIRFFSKDIAAKEFEQNFKYYKPSLDMIELHKQNNLDLLKHNQHLQNIKEKNNV